MAALCNKSKYIIIFYYTEKNQTKKGLAFPKIWGESKIGLTQFVMNEDKKMISGYLSVKKINFLVTITD